MAEYCCAARPESQTTHWTDAGTSHVMKETIVFSAALVGLVFASVTLPPATSTYAAQEVEAVRLPQNPLITVDTSPSLGGNVNGPTLIRVPQWVDRPLGRYYLYFANHMGDFIRLAYADAITGPWQVYEPGVLHVRDTAFFRPQRPIQ